MARTAHKNVKRVQRSKGRHHKATNSDLKQATHQGKAPVKDPRTAPSGYAGVPVSVTALTPGAGPPMSSTLASGVRGKNPNGKKRKPSRKSQATVQRIQKGMQEAHS